jgi:nicotinamidase-related amidase
MKVALLLIDIQNDYFPEGNMILEGSVEASLCARRLLDHFRGAATFCQELGGTREFQIPDTFGA